MANAHKTTQRKTAAAPEKAANAKKAPPKRVAAKNAANAKKAPPKKASTPSKPTRRVSTHIPRPKPPRSAHEAARIARAYDRVRQLCLARDGVYEKEAWSEATFRVERGKMFLMFADNHHDDGRVAFWCMSTVDSREGWLGIAPARFFVPPYVGPSGWVGMTIDGDDVPWDMAAEVIAEGHRLASPKAPPTRVRTASLPAAAARAAQRRAR